MARKKKSYLVYGTAQMAVVMNVEACSEHDAIDVANEARHGWELVSETPDPASTEAEGAKESA